MIVCTNRAHSDSKKWHKYVNTNIIPLWIADTDFEIALPIQQAIAQRMRHPVLGYPYDEAALLDVIIDYCWRRYHWHIKKQWLVLIPGCVPGINFARGVSILRGKHTAVTMIPTYPPFFAENPVFSFRYRLVDCLWDKQRWSIGFSALNRAVDSDIGLLLLCHPHNPIGRALTEEELREYASIAQRHNLIVCSDEIHCDLLLNGKQHRPFATLNDDALSRTITLMSASKTYNIAGLFCAFAIIADDNLRADFIRVSTGFSDVNVLGRVATMAALTMDDSWYLSQISYLRENASLVETYIHQLEDIHVGKVEASYLAFIDCRTLPVDNPQKYFELHGLGLADGSDYGKPGFVRLNFGCSRQTLEIALERFSSAVEKL